MTRAHLHAVIVATGLTLWTPGTAVANGFARRPDVGPTLHHEDPVIERALTELGQPLNRIAVISADDIRRIYARAGAGWPSPRLDAFRSPLDPGDPTIYVSRESPAYQATARTRSAFDLLKLTAILVHEQVHNTDIESAAYRLAGGLHPQSTAKAPGPGTGQGPAVPWSLEAKAFALAWAGRQSRCWRSSANESCHATKWQRTTLRPGLWLFRMAAILLLSRTVKETTL